MPPSLDLRYGQLDEVYHLDAVPPRQEVENVESRYRLHTKGLSIVSCSDEGYLQQLQQLWSDCCAARAGGALRHA